MTNTDKFLFYAAPDPVAFTLGPLSIHWYGLMYLLSFALIWSIARRRSRLTDWQPEQIDDLMFWGIAGCIIGGRTGYVLFYGWQHFISDPLWLFAVWQGGMSFHGGLLGVCCGMLYCARKYRVSPASVADFFVPLVPIGLGFGRLGNFINQELPGRVSDLPWALIYENDPLLLPRHPSQLYELFLEGILLYILLNYYARRKTPPYAVSAMFLLGYGILRFAVEFARQPDAPLSWEWMTRGQLLCLPMILLGGLMLFFSYRNHFTVSQK